MDKLLEGLVIGAHLFSVHSMDGLNDRNIGLYVRSPAGATAGFFENSNSRTRFAGAGSPRRISAYVAWTFDFPLATSGLHAAVTVGAVSGYGRPAQDHCIRTYDYGGCATREHLSKIDSVIPLLAPSVRVPLTERLAARVAYSYAPSGMAMQPLHIAHLMLEYRLGSQ
jgi:hypothetical protein